VQDGDGIIQIMESCLRVARLSRATLLSSCSVSNELCCQVDGITDEYRNVWSIVRSDGHEFLLTADENELTTLVSQGWGSQVCNPYVDPTAFCVNQGLLGSSMSARGPFILAVNPAAGRVALYRCILPGERQCPRLLSLCVVAL
jgi:hypothetical protein